jgi:hypothetical protein
MKRNVLGMIMKRIFIVALVMSLTQLTACSKSAPKCGDASTKKMVVDILRENVFYDTDYLKYHVLDIKNIRTKGTDKDTGKQSCEAEIDAQITWLKNTSDKVEGKKEASPLNGQTITYTSEITSEGKHFVKSTLPPLYK